MSFRFRILDRLLGVAGCALRIAALRRQMWQHDVPQCVVNRTRRSAAFTQRKLLLPLLETLGRQINYQLTEDPFDFRPGFPFGVIPASLQRKPSVFTPSENRIER
jgi:hypothetical protein